MPVGSSNAGLGIEAGLDFRAGSLFREGLWVRVRSQEVPGTETTAGQSSPRRAELRAQGTVPVTIPLCLPWTHMLFLPWSRRAPESSQELQPGLGNDKVGFKVPCRVSLHRFWTPGA